MVVFESLGLNLNANLDQREIKFGLNVAERRSFAGHEFCV